ncbi:MAG: sulfurtransferase [Burkholderiales bacterium]|uniref:sulfurtransferase n=1 Tax=Inhella sp. TaxID=1921806 RepID=UPI001AC39D65|nr:sulfurtransferase [Burkholderiales bacterium]
MKSPLITVAELQGLLPQDPLLLDIRFDLGDAEAGRRAYAAGHLPGSFYLHLDEDCCGPKRDAGGAFRGRHPLPDREVFAARLRQLGWHYKRPVVCIESASGMFAARLWWMLRWLGHEDVLVLDGGLNAWTAAGEPLCAEAPDARPQPPFPLREPLVERLDKATLRASLGRVAMVDARAAERFRGEVEPLDAHAGHIPGARNRPFGENLGADGRFKPAEQLRAEWAALHPSKDTVHSCGSGVSACHNLLALAAAGLPVGRLYGGSWSEWSADPAMPLARHTRN